MSTEPTETPPARRAAGRTRWRRFAAMLVATGAVTAVLVTLTAQGVLAAEFSISGMPFVVTATQLKGGHFEQFAVLDNMADNSPNAGNTGGQMVLIVSAIQDADLQNLCQSVSLGGEYLKLTAGTGSSHVTASYMVVDSSEMSGDADFNNIQIGQDASTLTQIKGVTGPLGVFGQQADSVTITNLRQTNYATTAGAFHLPGLSMRFSSTGC